ncbi:MAG TPA: GNAT family N-acetyltransferase [Acidimicrobiales bacterium]|nr:GNAT family N-acetyltransferase [Acidimicrobiales bacterium]
MTIRAACSCDHVVGAENEEAFPDAYLVHVRAAHADWPFPDLAVRVIGEALLRLTGGRERLDTIGEVVVRPVMPDRLGDWSSYMDHDAFVDKPWVAACFCLEQHEPLPAPGLGVWKQHRSIMGDRFRDGRAFGYLAYVDDKPAGWVNAAMRADQVYALSREDDATTITVSCFNISPPHRGHGVAAMLLDRVITDAPARGATRIEAYPRPRDDGTNGYSGSLDLYHSRGFEVIKELTSFGRLGAALVRRSV